MNKKEQYYVNNYIVALKQHNDSLYSIYKCPSHRKEAVWFGLNVERIKYEGVGLMCIGGSSYCFTAAYYIPGIRTVVYHTSRSVHKINVDEKTDSIIRRFV